MLPEGKLPRSVCLWGADLESDQLPRACIAVRDLPRTVGKLIEWATLFLPLLAAICITPANTATSVKVNFWSCLALSVGDLLKADLVGPRTAYLSKNLLWRGSGAFEGTEVSSKTSRDRTRSVLEPDIFSSPGIGQPAQNEPDYWNGGKINPPNGKDFPQEEKSRADKSKVAFVRR